VFIVRDGDIIETLCISEVMVFFAVFRSGEVAQLNPREPSLGVEDSLNFLVNLPGLIFPAKFYSILPREVVPAEIARSSFSKVPSSSTVVYRMRSSSSKRECDSQALEQGFCATMDTLTGRQLQHRNCCEIAVVANKYGGSGGC
jgi:hypothetical protein